MTFFEASVRARSLLVDAGIRPEIATLDADLLARHAAGQDLATWLARRGETADDAFLERYAALVQRRSTREPVAYIRGIQEFWTHEFVVTPAVLIPRPETELLIELAAPILKPREHARVVDVGTGSGCIAITLALEHPTIEVHAVDISRAALEVAALNARRLGASRIRFVHGSHLRDVAGPFDLIVTNPPYVAERDKSGLGREVRDHEPAVALFGGHDGWRDIQALLAQAPHMLAPDGVMLMELGYGQYERLEAEVVAVHALTLEAIREDLQGIPRAAVIRARA